MVKRAYLITKQLSRPQMSTATSSSAPTANVLAMKLVWNSPPDAEETYDTVFAELMTRLVYEGVDYVASEADSDAMVMDAPANPALNANAARLANHEKSMIKVNEQARKAMGILMGLFHPDCNAHRSLTEWYAKILPGLTPLQARRRDYNFRNAFEKWQVEYKPNKQYNLDSILKTWEALTDRDVSFAEFWGQYHKYRKEMEDIGHAPTVEKEYEMLRKAVTYPNLKSIVIQLNLPPAKRISLDDFFEDCLYVVRTSKELDTGRGNGKRKADGEAIVGRAVSMQKKSDDRGVEDTACYRCGKLGHFKYDRMTGARCQATKCTLCNNFIGTNAHSARGCCKRSNQVFPNGNFSADKHKSSGARGSNRPSGKSNSSEAKSKKGGRGAGSEKVSHYGPESEVSSSISVSSVPKELQQMRALLAQMESNHARSQNTSARRVVTSREDDD